MTPWNEKGLRLVVALGGNALVRPGEQGTIEQQFDHARDATETLARLVARGHTVALTHGNGPIVGNIVLRGEAARDVIPPMPLFISDADSEGGIGLMLQQVLHNHFVHLGVDRDVISLVTQTVVDSSDPAFDDPRKPIGPFMTETQARERETRDGWTVARFDGRGWRRLVASPDPLRLVESGAITALAEAGAVVIAAGGGGVPVVELPDGTLRGVDAVVDKDLAGALLACALGAQVFAILMESDAVYADWGGPDERRLERLGPDEARALLESDTLERGTIEPKLRAALRAAESCGCRSIICSAEALHDALDGRAGTTIDPKM